MIKTSMDKFKKFFEKTKAYIFFGLILILLVDLGLTYVNNENGEEKPKEVVEDQGEEPNNVLEDEGVDNEETINPPPIEEENEEDIKAPPIEGEDEINEEPVIEEEEREKVWVIDQEYVPQVTEEVWVVDKEAYKEEIPIFDKVPTWWVLNHLDEKKETFYSEEEAISRYNELQENDIESSLVKGEDEEVQVDTEIIEHEEEGHFETRIIQEEIPEEGHYEYR